MEKTEISLGEYKVLDFINGKKDVPEGTINIDNERIVSSSISYLESKKLIDVKKISQDILNVTDEGKKYINTGFPEEKLYGFLKEKKILTMEDIKNYMGDNYKIAIANIAKHGIRPADGKIALSDANLDDMFEGQRKKLSDIIEGKVPDQSTVQEFLHRGLVSKRKYSIRIININIDGLKVLENYEKNDYIEILTPELISSGKWKEMQFRPYDLNSRVEPVNGAGLHPLTYLIEKVRKIFLELGFTEMHGHFIEYTGWNMDMLFIPQDHPARDLQDTFYINSKEQMEFENPEILKLVKKVHEHGYGKYPGWNYKWSEEEARKLILRTHTTVNTIRYLYGHRDKPQFVFSIEKVFRHESVDWKHLSELYQIEGAAYGSDVNLSTLKWLLREFYSRLGFNNIRLIPSYYPYTEPSMDVAVDINGKEVELGGSGIFRPEVTKPLGLKEPVLAFGLGLERLAMLYYNLNDIREIYNSDLDWLKNYKIKF
ncbi:phenylalanine--tRNA ligase subunit alpha [Ferroplasma sp.]|uniref:phenylalanine--tRNA ligase subunit alpha n=1 Tax=Ferroplasma sp. TaxID=2591003 RepID=UPI00307FAC0B